MGVLYESLFNHVQPVLQSKLEEFHMQNYKEITIEDIWHYCITKKWKKKKVEELPVSEVVGTIFSLTPSEIISQAHIQELHKTDLNIGLDLEELNMLLKPLKSEE